MKSVVNGILKAKMEREENISRLISVFPEHKEDIKNHIRDIEIKTYGLIWCYNVAVTGTSWEDIKELLK